MKNKAQREAWLAKVGRWVWSDDEEYWRCEPTYATKQEAIAAARKETGWYYVGRLEAHDKWPASNPITWLSLDPADADCALCEAMDIAAEDTVFEFDEGAMEDALWAAFKAEIERQDQFPPRYYNVVEIESGQQPEPQ